jgi:hypothetical protein
MATLRVVLAMLLSGCVVTTSRPQSAPVSPLAKCLETCIGCCDERGLCRGGSSVSACGSRGTVCAACTGGEVCELQECRRPDAERPAAPAQPGDLTFRWRFSSQACAVVREVAVVTLDVPGLTLPNQGVFPCASGAADGVTLPAVPPGLYRFTARGLTSAGAALYESDGFVTVDGPVTKRIDLSPTSGGTGRALVSWRLPVAGPSSEACAATGVTQVAVQLPGRSSPLTARCDAGAVEVEALPAGASTVTLLALDAQGTVRAAAQGPVHAVVGATVAAEFGLTWQVGGLAVRWALASLGAGQRCGEAGVADVYLNLRGADGAFLYPGAGVAVPCETGAAVFPLLPVGQFELFAQAVGASGALYRSSAVPVRVDPGCFPDASAQAPLVWLVW